MSEVKSLGLGAKSYSQPRNPPRLVYTCRCDSDYAIAWSMGAEVWMCDDPPAQSWASEHIAKCEGELA